MDDLFYVVSIADSDGVTEGFVLEDLEAAEARLDSLRVLGGAEYGCYTPVSRSLDPITMAREVIRAAEAAWEVRQESAY